MSEENKPPRMGIVLPCFNEGTGLFHTAAELLDLLEKMGYEGLVAKDSYLLFVDDGSNDESWNVITQLHDKNKAVKGLKLSRNFGHQIALLAGLNMVTNNCDVAISIDADLQQNPLAIRDFLREFSNGSDVVLGVRRDRETDGLLKKATALSFYRLMRLMGVSIISNHADYRLLSRRALEALSQFPEPGIFLRATCLLLGFRVSTVLFDVRDRQSGQSKYSLRKMLRLALNGITSFSVAPLRLVAVTGSIFFLLSLIGGGYVAWRALIVGDTVPGWASTALPIYFIGGVQLLCLGIVGEYVGQIYITVKNRPRWICEYKLD